MPIDDDAIEAAAAEAEPPQDVTLEWPGVVDRKGKPIPLVVRPVHVWAFPFMVAQKRQDIAAMAVAILGNDQVDLLIENGVTDLGEIDRLLTACTEAAKAGEA